MVMRLVGNSKSVFNKALRTRSLLSFTAASGKPTIESDGKPLEICTSTVTGGASIPELARL